MTDRRNFLKAWTAAVAGMLASPFLDATARGAVKESSGRLSGSRLIVPEAAVPITGTFLDEITHDIPHQNWGEKEWDRDFRYMKAIGITDVIDIRCGYRKYLTYPSPYLLKKGCFMPSVDLIDMFCRLAEKHGMRFWFGLYDTGVKYPEGAALDIENNRFVIDEAWEMYGKKYKSFAGWYLSKEVSPRSKGLIESYHALGKQCKDLSGGLPVFISPYMDGKRTYDDFSGPKIRNFGSNMAEHESTWDEIFSGIHDVVDACAFQDGLIAVDEYDDFLSVNKQLTDKYGMASWTNAETFDRDMPIHFFPIAFENLRLKLEAAKRCGYDKAITFEFSHFMSPQSAYLQAGHLYNRYKEYFGIR
ncbi:MAG: DUF4434 domain-containing protein [Bacteroidales bacterium]|nr:DUF4434 domain-containing protein [Bacteroidales bacterium]